MRLYEHTPINLEGSAFRLVRLEKGSLSDPIQCEIFQAWLSDHYGGMPFEALSYTWGSTRATFGISINNHTMNITENLYDALLHLRSTDEDRVLWVDAICINQKNNEERSHQVEHMGRIYGDAERIIVWLGPANMLADFAMDAMARKEENPGEVEDVLNAMSTRVDMAAWLHETNTSIKESRSFEHRRKHVLRGCLKELLERPYWRRIWILQEIANARAATIVCGKKSIPARTFVAFFKKAELHPGSHCQAIFDVMPGMSRTESWWGEKPDLRTLLSKFRESKASDERDLIFALLGMSSDAVNSSVLRADYNKSSQEIIVDAMRLLLDDSSSDPSIWSQVHWTMPKFLQNLDSLSTALLDEFFETDTLLQPQLVNVLLLRNCAYPNLKDKAGRTALLRAVERGQEASVRFLLGCDEVDINLTDDGQSPLSLAIERKHLQIMRLLMEHKDVNVNVLDKRSKSPLSLAAAKCEEAFVKILLECNEVDINHKDDKGQTPLLLAAFYGNEAAVKLLLARHDIQADEKENSGKTPLLLAAARGYEAIVKMLIARHDIKADSKDDAGQTPLSEACRIGKEAVVEILLTRDDVNADSKDNKGRTPLSWSVGYHNTAILKILLARTDVNAELKDDNGRTPLSQAARCRNTAALKMLLACTDVNADSKDNDGRTPLSWAAASGSTAVLKMLLARTDVNADSKDYNGRTPLSWAAESGSWAADFGNETVTKLLLARTDVYADSRDKLGGTPLMKAAVNGNPITVGLLLMHLDVRVDSKDGLGKTPLYFATMHGHERVAEALVERIVQQCETPTIESKHLFGARQPAWVGSNGTYEYVRKLLLANGKLLVD